MQDSRINPLRIREWHRAAPDTIVVSDTPRSDAALEWQEQNPDADAVVNYGFAQMLERELAGANSLLRDLRRYLTADSTCLSDADCILRIDIALRCTEGEGRVEP